MTEDTKPGEMPTTPAGETPAETTQAKPQTQDELAAELEAARKALKQANREAAERRVKLEAFEKAEQERKQAEMTELEKLQAQLKDAQSQLERRALEDTKARIAKDVGLPDALAARIQGANEDEMKADAAKLLEALPKPSKNPVLATNPGAGAGAGETYEQKRARIYGSGADIFDPGAAAQQGGGVHWKTPD